MDKFKSTGSLDNMEVEVHRSIEGSKQAEGNSLIGRGQAMERPMEVTITSTSNDYVSND